jgi:hypothetical protein
VVTVAGLWAKPDKHSKKLFARLPESRHRPLLRRPDLDEIVRVFDVIPGPLEYPINSAGELIEKLGGPGTTFRLDDVEMDPLYLVKAMPAYYFPIADAANFAEKMAELIRLNRKASTPEEADEIVGRLDLGFPIADRDGLASALDGQRVVWRGEELDPKEWIDRVPDSAFPIESHDDLRAKTMMLLTTRPIVVGEETRR